jgi:hypothetical protein
MALSSAQLADHEEIRQVMYTFFRAADRRDAELGRTTFWEDGHCESSAPGEPVSHWMPSLLDEAAGKSFERNFEKTMHYMLNMVIRVDGDSAAAETYAIAYHIVPARHDSIVAVGGETRFAELGSDASRRYELSVGTRYNSRFERRDGVWRIKIHRYIVEWTRFVPYEGVHKDEGVLAFMRLSGTRDRSDASYEWLPTSS